ncbi:hypothetical protein D3C72_2342570 [compost metagenome]
MILFQQFIEAIDVSLDSTHQRTVFDSLKLCDQIHTNFQYTFFRIIITTTEVKVVSTATCDHPQNGEG